MHPRPTADELLKAREMFVQHEPRDLFYRVATYLIEHAMRAEVPFTLTEAVSVILQTWNRRYYQKGRRFDVEHVSRIDVLIGKNLSKLMSYRGRTLDTLLDGEEGDVIALFSDFEGVLGRVGAAKCLHLLAPSFFPLWDNAIAQKYGLYLGAGAGAQKYWRFMLITREQVVALKGSFPEPQRILKALDEYNYCKFTLGLL